MLIHQRTQHAIGQGFFHTASLEVEAAEFHYVYDCGSISKTLLREEIAAYVDYLAHKDRSELDVLFISHLDSDHVNGLDTLLGLGSASAISKLGPFPPLSGTADRSISKCVSSRNSIVTGLAALRQLRDALRALSRT